MIAINGTPRPRIPNLRSIGRQFVRDSLNSQFNSRSGQSL